ncbi:MAG: SAM-dependent methyltransferase [Burkholderiaceae bacterium]
MNALDIEPFLARLDAAMQETASAGGSPSLRLVLSKPRAAGSDLLRVAVRPVTLRGEAGFSLVYSHATRDLTVNLSRAVALARVRSLLAETFQHAHLRGGDAEVALLISRQGRVSLRETRVAKQPGAAPAADVAAHDRAKQRWVDIGRPFLVELGVTDAQHRLVPAMARKWKQINKFVEVFDHAFAASELKDAPAPRVVDFGAGKGYVTFALHDHLQHRLGRRPQVRGVELRADLVALGNATVQRLGIEGLAFELGDVREQDGATEAASIDVMIALHACDTATDRAIHLGVRAGAAVILVSPCCHKELRPQLLAPHPLRPMLQHGIHLGQHAEMLTDSLRALLLEACGYQTQVFEFVALEHSQKNKMILAVRRPAGADSAVRSAALRAQVAEVKTYHAIREQCLERLLVDSGLLPQPEPAPAHG